eukprot:gene2939-5774_t
MTDTEKRKFEGGQEQDGQPKKLPSTEATGVVDWTSLAIATSGLLQLLPVQEEMEIPQSKVGIVIGAKGVIIQEIMRRSQCKIVINQDFPEGEPRKIVYNGLPANIASAKELIALVIAGGPSALQTGSPVTPDAVEMDCPQEKVGLVIGTRGTVIQDIMRRSGCKIVVNQDFPDGTPRKILFSGAPEQISEAQSLIYAIIFKTNPNDNDTTNNTNQSAKVVITKEMECPQEKVGVVIGSKGVIIQEMMRRTGSKMTVNQDFPDGCPRKVVITGTEEQIEAAMALVTAVIQQGPAGLHVTGPGLVTQDINIIQAQVGKIIGPAGQMIKDIQQRCGVRMVIEQEYADTDDRKIRITGEADKVQSAVQMVCQLLDPITAANYAVSNAGAPYGMPGQLQQGGGYGPMGGMGGGVGGGMPSASSPGILALGADGQAGQLLPATTMTNGMQHQVAMLKKTIAGKVIGKGGTVLNLIKQKSGASCVVEHQPTATGQLQQSAAALGQEICRINITGMPQCVTLASQMIQEVLVNGPGKLQSMADYVQPVQQQQHQQQLAAYQYAQSQAAYAQQQYMYQQQQYYGAQQQQQQQQQQYAYAQQPMAAPQAYAVPAATTSPYPATAQAPVQATTATANATATSTAAAQQSMTPEQYQQYMQQYQQYYAQYYQAQGYTMPTTTGSDGTMAAAPGAMTGAPISTQMATEQNGRLS